MKNYQLSTRLFPKVFSLATCFIVILAYTPLVLPSIVFAAGIDDLSISVTDNRDNASNGDTVNYSITISNNSPTEVQSISGRNFLPAFVDFISADIPG